MDPRSPVMEGVPLEEAQGGTTWEWAWVAVAVAVALVLNMVLLLPFEHRWTTAPVFTSVGEGASK